MSSSSIDNLEKKFFEAGIHFGSSSSRAKVDVACALALSVLQEQLYQCTLPASDRRTLEQLWIDTRISYGGDEKELDRAKYDICSVAKNLHLKLLTEHKSFFMDLAKKNFASAVLDLSGAIVNMTSSERVFDLKEWLGYEMKRNRDKEKFMKAISDIIPNMTLDEIQEIRRELEHEIRMRTT